MGVVDIFLEKNFNQKFLWKIEELDFKRLKIVFKLMKLKTASKLLSKCPNLLVQSRILFSRIWIDFAQIKKPELLSLSTLTDLWTDLHFCPSSYHAAFLSFFQDNPYFRLPQKWCSSECLANGSWCRRLRIFSVAPTARRVLSLPSKLRLQTFKSFQQARVNWKIQKKS